MARGRPINTEKFPGVQGEQRLAWIRSRAQALYRDEVWAITWEEFQDLWQGRWHLRGRCRDNICLTRFDHQGDWHVNNCEFVTRQEHMRRQAQSRKGRKYAKRALDIEV